MILYPAIDLLEGNCVRLYKGDYAQQTVYSHDPVGMAATFLNAGAEWIHIVDLSGAKDSSNRQTQLIERLVKSTQASVQTGGGIRTISDVQALLACGAKRVVIGSLAVKNIPLTTHILTEYGGDSVTIALDVLNGHIAVSGWQEETKQTLEQLIETYLPYGLKHVLCTDIGRDGTLQGPNTALYTSFKHSYPSLHIQASGGIATLNDLENLNKSGINGAIIGKALYEGCFTLDQALKAVAQC